jgi:hypothetical protein
MKSSDIAAAKSKSIEVWRLVTIEPPAIQVAADLARRR